METGRYVSFDLPERYPIVVMMATVLCVEAFLFNYLIVSNARAKFFNVNFMKYFYGYHNLDENGNKDEENEVSAVQKAIETIYKREGKPELLE